ncbi:hypothetical protein L596_011044 [Steinernema carpocapsae]|uniref:Uncharacterized protein n=1 Tax=Steinernema carpocapsae TaxID=34508 RepID=A0A4U5NTJ1_STECR|nr:hypothetical protein L596_011044 [Steinernema carpocapsae]
MPRRQTKRFDFYLEWLIGRSASVTVIETFLFTRNGNEGSYIQKALEQTLNILKVELTTYSSSSVLSEKAPLEFVKNEALKLQRRERGRRSLKLINGAGQLLPDRRKSKRKTKPKSTKKRNSSACV